jgi:hypothetical protein
MQTSVYKINKGINKSIEFKGLKAQFIWYLGAGLVGLLITFALMYLIGVNTYLSLGLIFVAGGVLFAHIYKLSGRYGQYGMMKKAAGRLMPNCVRCRSKKIFVRLRKN